MNVFRKTNLLILMTAISLTASTLWAGSTSQTCKRVKNQSGQIVVDQSQELDLALSRVDLLTERQIRFLKGISPSESGSTFSVVMVQSEARLHDGQMLQAGERLFCQGHDLTTSGGDYESEQIDRVVSPDSEEAKQKELLSRMYEGTAPFDDRAEIFTLKASN